MATYLVLTIIGDDKPGLVEKLSETIALAAAHVNVEELSTHISSAPMSGEALFNAKAVLKVPVDLDIDTLQSQLERLADDLIVEIALAPIE